MAGYSDTPLVKKLGIREGARVALIGAPDGFAGALAPLPAGAALLPSPLPSAPAEGVRGRRPPGAGATAGPPGASDVILLFATVRSRLCDDLPLATRALHPAGGLWIAWPKRASGVPTDLTEGDVREIGLAAGLVDNKVCAIDDVWSGLRFVVRLADRAAWPTP
jgi:hypothetical protein